jgi:hypothetical protein
MKRGVVIRAVRYLGPLLRDALAHLWRMVMEAADGAQFLLRSSWARQHPETKAGFNAWREELRARRDGRWAPWRGLTTVRRMELNAASVALVLIALWIARASSEPPSLVAESETGPTGTASSVISSEEGAPAVDFPRALARMRSEMARATPGQALFLAEGPILAPGSSETWSGFRVAAPVVLRAGDGFQLWYRGCRLHGFEHDCAIGHATSADGLEWTTTQDAVLVPSDGADEFDLGWIAVVRVQGTYFLWYSVAPDEFDSRPTSVLHLATSKDGLRWQDHGRVLTTEERTVPVQPSAVHDGTRFHLWFADSRRDVDGGYELRDGAPFLRHFISQDGRSWQEAGQCPIGPLGLGRLRVSVTREGDGSYRAFFFSRAEDDATDDVSSSVGWLASADGTDWRMANRKPVAVSSLGSDVRQITDAVGMRVEAGLLAWFVTQREDERLDIRAAFYKE